MASVEDRASESALYRSPSVSWKDTCSIFLFILLFHVNSQFFPSFCSALYLVYSRLSIHFTLFHLFVSFLLHSSFAH